MVAALIAIAIVTVAAVAAYALLGQSTPAGSTPNPGIALQAYALTVSTYQNGTRAFVYPFLQVQNTWTKPLVSLVGQIQGTTVSYFRVLLPSGCNSSECGAIDVTTPLYPNEVATSSAQSPLAALQSAKPGDTYNLVLDAMFADGSRSSLTVKLTATAHGRLPLCRSRGNSGLAISQGGYSVDNATGMATWTASIHNNQSMPLDVVVAGMNNGTVWMPFDYAGSAITRGNPLPGFANVTQTFTWSVVPHTERNIFWACDTSNSETTIGTN